MSWVLGTMSCRFMLGAGRRDEARKGFNPAQADGFRKALAALGAVSSMLPNTSASDADRCDQPSATTPPPEPKIAASGASPAR